MALTLNLKPTISVSSSSFHHHPSSFSPFFSLKTQTKPFSFTTRIHNLQYPSLSLTFSRRFFILPSVSGIWDALTGNNNPKDAVIAIRRGMLLFRQGDVPGSVVEFDKAIELDPRQKIFGKGDYHCTILIGLKKLQSSLE